MKVEWVRLGDVLELQRRAVTVDPEATYREVGVRSFGRGLFLKDPVSGTELGNKRVFHVEPEDLVVSNVFAWEGAVGVADERHRGTIGSHRFMTWRPCDASSVDVRFLAYYLGSDPGLAALREASPGSAGRNRTLSIKSLKAIEAPLPPLADQRRIAAHLDSVDASARVAARTVEQQATTLGPEQLPAWLAGTLSGFATVPVGELCDMVSDTVHPGDDVRGADTFVGLEHIESHTGQAIGSRTVKEEGGRKFRFESGDLTYGYLRPYLNKTWAADRTGLCSVEQFVLRPRPGIDPCDLSTVLRSDVMLRAAKEATNNLQLPRLKQKTLLETQVPDPRQLTDARRWLIQRTHERFVKVRDLRMKQNSLVSGLVPAARNEIFSAMH